MQPRLEGFASALLGALDDAGRARAAQELTSLELTILARSDLRAMLADTALAGVTRGLVLGELLAGKVSTSTQRLAVYAATYVPAQEVTHAMGEVAILARTHAETGVLHLPGLALLAARERISGFADALLENTPIDEFAGIENELFTWARTVEANESLRRLLLDRDSPLAARLGVTEQLLGARVAPVTLSLARFVVEGGRPRDMVGTLDFLVDFVARTRDWRVARVRSARDLDDASRAQLADSLGTLTGHSVELLVIDDASLLGGVLVEVGDLRLDASTRGRLGELREAIVHGRNNESVLTATD